jgi:hypothetical protein
MAPAAYALDLYRGDTFARTFVLWQDAERTQPVDLTDATARAQVRDEVVGELIVELVASIELPNTVQVGLAADDWPAGSTFTAGVWDLELTFADGSVSTIAAGPVRVSGDVTRAG